MGIRHSDAISKAKARMMAMVAMLMSVPAPADKELGNTVQAKQCPPSYTLKAAYVKCPLDSPNRVFKQYGLASADECFTTLCAGNADCKFFSFAPGNTYTAENGERRPDSCCIGCSVEDEIGAHGFTHYITTHHEGQCSGP